MMNIELTCKWLNIRTCFEISYRGLDLRFGIDFLFIDRILDNLPLVVPMTRLERDSPVIYQHGYFVGRKIQYAGVSINNYTFCYQPSLHFSVFPNLCFCAD